MIVAAAVKYGNKVFALPAPARHHNVMWYAIEQYGSREKMYEKLVTPEVHAAGGLGFEVQGFIDHEEGFVNRERAFKIVVEQKQPLAVHQQTGEPRREPDRPWMLFSEDVW